MIEPRPHLGQIGALGLVATAVGAVGGIGLGRKISHTTACTISFNSARKDDASIAPCSI